MIFEKDIALGYDSWYETARGAFIDKVESQAAFELFSPEPGYLILDAGCGTGNFSIKLSKMGCHVTGIDISPDMLAIARLKANCLFLPIDFIAMDMDRLNLPDNCFDGVFSMAAWEFICEPDKAFAELYRVLKPGGKLLIGTINKDSSWGQLYMETSSSDPLSVFASAQFKNSADLAALAPDKLVAQRGCLFIPPQAGDSEFNWDSEEAYRASGNPGFIIAMWQKS